jgi:hypothetical protein
MKQDPDQRSPRETARIRDETLRRMAHTKPQTQKQHADAVRQNTDRPKPGRPKAP